LLFFIPCAGTGAYADTDFIEH